MGNNVFYLVTFVSVFLASTKMATSESGSDNDDEDDDVRVPSSSSTSALSTATTTDCLIANSRVSVCSTNRSDDNRKDDMRSSQESGVTMTSTISFSVHDVTTNTTSQPVYDDVTSGASCDGETPRKSERDPRFHWKFFQPYSYLNVSLTESSQIVKGYFVVRHSECEELRWNVTVVNGSQRKTINIVSRRISRIADAFVFGFSLEKLEAKEIYVAFHEGQREETTKPKQQDEQRRQPHKCESNNSVMVDAELFRPCDDPTKAINELTSEAIAVSNDTASTSSRPSYDYTNNSSDDDDRIGAGTTLEHENLEHGTSTQNPFPSSTRSVYPATDPLTPRRSNRPTPPPFSSTTTTLMPSTESLPDKLQKYKGSFRITNQDFLPNLDQETTIEYKSLHSKIHPLLNASYSSSFGPLYHGIKKIGFRSGSIIVDNWFEIFGNFSEQLRNRSSTNLVEEFSRNGMDIDPTSFKFEPDKGKKADDEHNNDKLLLIVIVSSVLGVLLLVLLVVASMLIWRKSKQRKPEEEDDFERQRAALETRTSEMISGMPRSQLMWQNMPSLKAGFDDQSLFVYEMPNPSSAKVHQSTHHRPSASSSSASSSPKESLSYSQSRPSFDSKRDPKFYIPRPRTIPESTVATSFSGISSRGLGNSQRRSGNSQRHSGNSQHDGVEASQDWGQLPLDYNSMTHDYFVGGPSTIAPGPGEEGDAARAQPTRPRSRTMKLSSRKSVSAPDAVDFGNVFLPSSPPFRLADVLHCYELPLDEVNRSGKATRRSTADGWGEGGSRRVEPEEMSTDDANNNTSCGPYAEKNGQQNRRESGCSTDRCCSQSLDRSTAPTQLPQTSGLTSNSHMNLLASIYARSPKKKQKSPQAPDNIHRSTTFALADDVFLQNINYRTSEL